MSKLDCPLFALSHREEVAGASGSSLIERSRIIWNDRVVKSVLWREHALGEQLEKLEALAERFNRQVEMHYGARKATKRTRRAAAKRKLRGL